MYQNWDRTEMEHLVLSEYLDCRLQTKTELQPSSCLILWLYCISNYCGGTLHNHVHSCTTISRLDYTLHHHCISIYKHPTDKHNLHTINNISSSTFYFPLTEWCELVVTMSTPVFSLEFTPTSAKFKDCIGVHNTGPQPLI